MRKTHLAICVLIGFGLLAGQGFGFFDDLLNLPSQKEKAPPSQGQGGQPEQTGLIEGLGGLFGVEQKDLDLIKKGLGVIQALQPIGEEEEIVLGQAVAVEAFSRFGGEYRNESLTRYVNLVGQTVAEVSDRPELQYHFAILNSREQNAFAAPGGYIFVTIGLMKTLKNEAELAGVLAHEVAHVTQKHMLETIRRGAILSHVSEFTLSAMDEDPRMFSNVIDEITDKLFTKGLDQELEFEADVYGVEYTYRAGYNPEGLRDYLVTLKGQEGRARSRFFTTHPSTRVRIGRVIGTLGGYADAATFPFAKKRFQTRMQAA